MSRKNIIEKKVMEMISMNYEFCDGVTHTIKKGDTLYEISRKYKVPLALLLRANPYVDVFNLQVGDTICVPANPGQSVPYPMNGTMRTIETEENQQGTTVQMPSAMNLPEDMQRHTARPMMEQPSGSMWQGENGCCQDNDGSYGEGVMDNNNDKEEGTQIWEKYVVQPGDTLADVMADMKGNVEDFVDKNGPASIYMLPGVAYYICK